MNDLNNKLEKRTQALTNSVKYMRAFLDVQPSITCIIDKDNDEIIDGSQKFLYQFGYIDTKKLQEYFIDAYEYNDIESKYSDELLKNDDWVHFLLINRKNTYRISLNINEEIKSFEISAHNMLYSSGISDEDYKKFNFVVIVMNDITRLIDETKKNKEKEQVMFQQSRFAQMGEMIGAIAHQWRQPLSSLALAIQDIGDAYAYNELNETYIQRVISQSMKQIDYMSKTIDDFRDFFKPTKTKKLFSIKNSLEEVEKIISNQLVKYDISINIEGEDLFIDSYKNEFKQVLLNLIANSKDAIKSKQNTITSLQGEIKIYMQDEETMIKIFVEDNGGGIPENIMDRIFEPYFTTKFKAQGTGIGLYMSKIIVEKNIGGKLYCYNNKLGAIFVLEIPKDEKKSS